jgi:uncharacterized protein with HEPN domain
MNPRDVRKLLFDIERAGGLIQRFLEGISLETFLGDELLQSAIERQSEVIGEALKKALDLDQSLANHITDARRIIAFRNRLIHGYADVSPQIVWGIANGDIPTLLAEVREIMKTFS